MFNGIRQEKVYIYDLAININHPDKTQPDFYFIK
jgi:hypothetical protein